MKHRVCSEGSGGAVFDGARGSGKGRSPKTARPRPCDAFVAHVPDVSHRALFPRRRRKTREYGEVGLRARQERACVRGKRRSGAAKASASSAEIGRLLNAREGPHRTSYRGLAED
jgi:hypothetical protein